MHDPYQICTVDVDSFKVFYREAGSAGAPKLLLLHGFPSAGHMFRDLIPLLADRFHIVAPDLPGFGQSDKPPREKFSYTFDNIAHVIDRFTEIIGFDRFAVYVFDYGAPTGFRLAVRHPVRITAIISQNGAPTKKVSARAGLRSGPTGRTRRRQTEGAPRLPHPEQPAGGTRRAYPIRRSCRLTDERLDNFYLARPVLMKCSSISSTITRATSHCIRHSRNISARTSPRFWRYGARTIHSLCLRALKRSSATFLVRLSASSTPATSHWKRMPAKSRKASAIS